MKLKISEQPGHNKMTSLYVGGNSMTGPKDQVSTGEALLLK